MIGMAPPDTLRERCAGVVALSARLEPWQRDLCGDPAALAQAMAMHGSPVNVIDPSVLGRNAAELAAAAAGAGVELDLYFARKANKSLALVDAARGHGLGVDLASQAELRQCLERGLPGSALIMTAAIKPAALLDLCVAQGVTVAVDNHDELEAVVAAAGRVGEQAQVALRLAPALDGPPTRFGFAVADALDAARRVAGDPEAIRIRGVHFHVDGYAAQDRVRALDQALGLVDGLVELGHAPAFVDIGGGIPMSYLESEDQWDAFWQAHRQALLGERQPLTYDGHGLGLTAHEGQILGRPNVYPAHQTPIRAGWLREVLRGQIGGEKVAHALRRRDLVLRAEPGRSMLDGAGLTAARVEYRKQRADGAWLIGLAMNRTQCRSTADDFLVDPLLLRPDPGAAQDEPIEGYLVGAYCIERELLTWRRMVFSGGVRVGDIVVFPNTAGYFMHILESSSHQIPLARNLIRSVDGGLTVDPIDGGSARP